MLACASAVPFVVSRTLSHHPDDGVLHLGNRRHPVEPGARRRRHLLAGADGAVCLRLLWHGDARLSTSIWPLWLAMPASAVLALAVSMLIGLACLRLKGPYVALLTLAIAQVIYLADHQRHRLLHHRSKAAACRCSAACAASAASAISAFVICSGRNSSWPNYLLGLALLAAAFAFSVDRHPRSARPGVPGLARQSGLRAVSRGISQFRSSCGFSALSALFHRTRRRRLCRRHFASWVRRSSRSPCCCFCCR